MQVNSEPGRWFPPLLASGSITSFSVTDLTPSTQDVVHELAIRPFFRASYDTAKARRDKQFGYHVAGASQSLTAT